MEGNGERSDDVDEARAYEDGHIGYALELFELLKHHWQEDASFQAGQWCADTEMDAMPKGKVFIGLPADIQSFGICKRGWIMIGGGIPCLNDCIRRNALSAQFDFGFGATEDEPDRW